MKRSAYYQLTVAHWPEAVKLGLSPVRYDGFANWQPNYYRPFTFDFRHAPTREDFAEVISQLPWAHNADWLPVIAANDWPLIQRGYKASSVDLTSNEGQVVGRLEAARCDLWDNDSHYVPSIWVDDIQKATSHLRCNRQAARDLLGKSENKIRERVMTSGDYSEQRVQYEIRRVLHKAGLLKTKPKEP